MFTLEHSVINARRCLQLHFAIAMAKCGPICVFFIWLMCHEIVNGNLLDGEDKREPQPRSLIFPVTAPTRIQFIGGVGVPVQDLAYESVTSGYVFKAEYFLPYEAQQLHPNYLSPQLIHRRSINETYSEQHNSRQSSTFGVNLKSQQKTASSYRWTIYRGIEMLIDRSGQPGRTCLMRSICEHAAFPLNYESGMLAEILHIILTPSTSYDDFMKHSNKDYLQAEKLGRTGTNCETEFSACVKSPIDQISTIFDVSY